MKNRKDWCAAVYGVTKSQTWPSNWTTTTCAVSWIMFHDHLKRMCILLLLDEMFHTYLLSPFCLIHSLRPVFPYWFSFLMIYPLIFAVVVQSIGISRVLKSPSIIVLLSMSSFMSVNICFMYSDASMLSLYIFIIVIFSFLD